MRFRYRQLSVVCAAMGLAIIAPLLASGDRADVAVLKKIASRVTDRTGIITIEASDPVPYVASQPDPHTFVVELRDVVAIGFADGFTADPRHTVSAVQVESGQSFDGAAVARIRMTLSQATRPRVRSSRNIIYVETDRLDRVTSAGSISTAGPASAIRDLRVTKRGEATAITFRGSGRLMFSGIEEPKEGPPRLIIDLPNSTSALPSVTPVAQGPVDKVRIGLNEKSPLVTRVTLDLTRKSTYRIESSVDRLRRRWQRRRLRRCKLARRHLQVCRRCLHKPRRRLLQRRLRPPRRRSRSDSSHLSHSRRQRRASRRVTPACRSVSISRVPICEPCCAPSPRSAASTS